MLATKNYGFVAFKSEIERDRVIGKLVTIHGKQARIAHDTREHKRTTGVMDEIWVRAHGSFTPHFTPHQSGVFISRVVAAHCTIVI